MEIEAAHWARTRRQDEVVVVVTRGSIDWHEIRSTLLPASLASWMASEHVLVDLRPQVDALRTNPRDPAIRGQMVEALKQTATSPSSWEHVGNAAGQEERRQRKVALLWLTGTVFSLLVLTTLAVISAYNANRQKKIADDERVRAEQQKKIADDERQKAVTENNRFETYFELISQERTFSINEVSDVEDPVALAQSALLAGRNIARRDIRGVTILWVDDKPRNNEKKKEYFATS